MLNKNNKNKNKQCTWPGEGLCYEARETLTLQKWIRELDVSSYSHSLKANK